jgi:hypothetical protein
MKGWLYVDTPEQYEAWARQRGVLPGAPAAQGS